MDPGALDLLKTALLLRVRHVNRASIERWSRWTYRRRARATDDAVESVPAAVLYDDPTIPSALRVPRRVPPSQRLGPVYVATYYGLAAAAFELYRRHPISPEVAWNPSLRVELHSDEGWDDILADAEFAAMRVQGPNPYLLARETDGPGWIADYGPSFRGVHAPVACEFDHDGQRLMPRAIRVAGERFAPTDAGWHRAKVVANALDARYAVFVQHLLRTHLVVGQAYALAAAELPRGHRLRAFADVHTYGTLHVNSYAWRLLLAPTSYFIQSRFITRPDALRLFANSLEAFRFDDMVPSRDAAARGLARFPAHPYQQEAERAWDAILAYTTEVAATYEGDDEVRGDAALRAWHARLRASIPGESALLSRLDTRDELAVLLACLVFNNVVHEVSGDFSPYATSTTDDVKRLVNFAELASGGSGPPRLNDVFLFEQGAFSGMFNTAGNNMVATPVDRFAPDAAFLGALTRFREALLRLDGEVEARDAERRYKLRRMRPRQWELSVSF